MKTNCYSQSFSLKKCFISEFFLIQTWKSIEKYFCVNTKNVLVTVLRFSTCNILTSDCIKEFSHYAYIVGMESKNLADMELIYIYDIYIEHLKYCEGFVKG